MSDVSRHPNEDFSRSHWSGAWVALLAFWALCDGNSRHCERRFQTSKCIYYLSLMVGWSSFFFFETWAELSTSFLEVHDVGILDIVRDALKRRSKNFKHSGYWTTSHIQDLGYHPSPQNFKINKADQFRRKTNGTIPRIQLRTDVAEGKKRITSKCHTTTEGRI